ncbi:amino acid permease/ SLC12A domain-containing protein [Mariannaea sp. PMI_226]|nr:amino acid permease/ SLC12A domain-containing protein [Mariannaea sp. PMI_226]
MCIQSKKIRSPGDLEGKLENGSVLNEQSLSVPTETTHRGIKSRHAQMLAIGGTIGTGLFVGSGQALNRAGPAMLLAGYITISILVYGMITATTEMSSYLPVTGCSMAHYGTRFVSKSLGFAMGWLYWYSFGILIAYEITAASLVIDYWPNSVPTAVWITIMLVVIVSLNILPVRFYAETEFWFASLKVFTIIGLLILSFILCVGGGPDHDRLGFRYWKDPGPAKEYLTSGSGGYFSGYLYVTTFSVFAFNFAPELLVLTAGEMQDPQTNLPKAAKRYFYRLITFYILGSLAVGVICSSNAPGLTNETGSAASPWVIAIKAAGIHSLDSVINAVIITSAWSSGNSYLYMSSRTLYSLAMSGSAPKVFTRCNRWGLPYYAVFVSSLFTLLAYMNINSNASAVFNWLINLTNTAGFTSWVCCCIIYLRFRKARIAQEVDLSTLPYLSITQPWMAWVCMVLFSLLCLCNGFYVFFPGHWSVSSFLTAYLGLPIFLSIYLAHRIYHYKDPWAHKSESVDLHTGLEFVRALAPEVNESAKDSKRLNLWKRVKLLWD